MSEWQHCEIPVKEWERVLADAALTQYADMMRHTTYYLRTAENEDGSPQIGSPPPRVLKFLEAADNSGSASLPKQEARRAETIQRRFITENALTLRNPQEMRTFLQAVDLARFNKPYVTEKNGAVMTAEKFILRRLFFEVESDLVETSANLHYTRVFLDESGGP